jgi:hypothetical protein
LRPPFLQTQDLLYGRSALEPLLKIGHHRGDFRVLRLAPKSNRGGFGHGLLGAAKLFQRLAMRLPRENEIVPRTPRV